MEDTHATMEDRIQEIQNQFYSTSGKNTFFKKAQKFQCAQTVASELTPQILLESTFRTIPGTNRLYVSYPLFKTFMCPETYALSINYLVHMSNIIVEQYGTLEVHIDVQSFTPTAAERYREFVVQICKECEKRGTNFSSRLTRMNIYNCPAVAEHIAPMLCAILPPETRTKICTFSKEASGEQLAKLFA